jgi:hypothetical protein
MGDGKSKSDGESDSKLSSARLDVGSLRIGMLIVGPSGREFRVEGVLGGRALCTTCINRNSSPGYSRGSDGELCGMVLLDDAALEAGFYEREVDDA